MAINERLIHTASDSTSGASGNQQEGLIFHVDANDVDSYDGNGSVWYDITNHEYTPEVDPAEHFNTVTYTGNGSSSGQSITGVGFQPDLVWVKERGTTGRHQIQDSVNGDGWLDSSDTLTYAPSQAHIDNRPVETFDSDGFTIPSNYTYNNGSNDTFVAWCLKAGGAPTATNTATSGAMTANSVSIDGELQSAYTPSGSPTKYPDKLSINTKLGFSIALIDTGNGTKTFPHGLSQQPEMVIIKNTENTGNWLVYHKDLGESKYLRLHTTDAATTSSNIWDVTPTTFKLQHNAAEDWVMYSFISKRGISKVGTYMGTGSSGNKVYTGFEPAWVMMKETNTSGRSWLIVDNKRKESNGNVSELFADTTTAESGTGYDIDFNSDGFTLNTTTTNANASGGKYIYLAFAKSTNETELATTTTGVWSGFQSAVSSITSDSTSTTGAPGTADTATTHSMFDNTEYFSMGDNGTSEASNEIFITLNAAKSIKGYAVYEMFQSGYKYTGTTKLYGSTDNSYWYLLGSTSQTTSIQKNRNETTFAATPEYQYYKFTLSGNTRGTYQGAWQLEFISDEDITPDLHLDAASYSGSGSTWTADAGNDGTITGATYNDELGNYFDFDGNDSITSAGNLSVPNENFTVEFWTRPDSTSTSQNFFEIEDTSGNRRISMVVNTGNTFRCYIYEASGFNNSAFPTSTTTFDTGKWYHVTVTFEKGVAAKMYINGELDVTSTTNVSAARLTTYGETNIGTGAFGSLTGAIGQYRFYDKVLSAVAIRQNYNYTKPSYPNGKHATLSSATWDSEGSFSFQSSQWATIPTGSFIGDNDQIKTICAWVKADTTTSRVFPYTISSESSNAQYFSFGYYGDNSRVYVSCRNGSSSNQFQSYFTITPDTEWHHIAVTFDGTTRRMYLDGVEQATTEDNRGSATSSSWISYAALGSSPKAYIGRGRHVSSWYSDGKMSDIKYFDKQLSDDEIEAEYNKGQFGNN